MADAFDEEDIFAVFDQDSPADTSKKRKYGDEKGKQPSSSNESPQTSEKRDIKEVLNDPLLFDVDDSASPGTSSSSKKQKIDDTDR